MSKRPSWLLGPLAALLCLVAAPLVFAAGGGKHPAVAHAARLRACTIVGTQGDDTLVGTPGDDVICARGGDDVVYGGGGDDVIYGGPGNDVLRGGAGNDRLYGYQGADRLDGGPGNDFLQGGLGPDVLSGGPGEDLADYSTRRPDLRVTLGHGADDGFAGEGDDVRGDVEDVAAGRGDDVLIGDGAANTLRGGAGDDRIVGGGGRDRLDGGPGRDRIDARDGFADTVDCGQGGGDRVLSDPRDRVGADCRRGRPAGTISLSHASVAEHLPAGTLVGTLSVRGGRGPYAFRLTGGPFRVVGTRLVTNAVLDFATRQTYSVRIQAVPRAGRTLTRAFTITVVHALGATNHAPTDIALSSASVAENLPAGTPVGVLSTTDPDAGDTHAYALVPGAGSDDNGAFTIAGAALQASRSFDFEAKSSYTIRVRTTDAAGATFEKAFTIAVLDRNDPPVAVPQLVTGVTEDGSRTIQLTGTDQDGSALTFHVATPLHGAVDTATPPATCATAGHCTATVVYTPARDFNGNDTFTFTVNDGALDSAAGAVTATVDAVDDAPVLTVPTGPVTALPGADTALPGLTVSDVDADPGDLSLTLSVANGTLSVDTLVVGGVLQATGNGTGHVVVTASQAALRTTLAAANGLVYHAGAAGPDTLTVTADDLGNTGAGGPLSATKTEDIVVDHPPVAGSQNATTAEDTPAPIALAAADADGDPLTFAIVSEPAHGTLTGAGAARTYTPDPDYNGPDSFTFTTNDGHLDSAPATVAITVTPVDDPPRLLNTEGTALGYTENDPATPVTATSTVSDVDSPNFDTGTLTADFSTGGTADDRLEITPSGQIGVSGANVTFAGTTIGSFTGGTGTTPLEVTLNASADAAATQALLRAITYRNVSDAPATAPRTIRFVLSDGDGATSAPATRTLDVTAVDDPPVLDGIEAGPLAYTESVDAAPAQAPLTGGLTVADVDSPNLTAAVVQITGGCQPGEDVLAFAAANGITGTYTAATCRLQLAGSASPADYQAALRTVAYEDTSDTPNTAPRSVEFTVNDGTAGSNAQARTVTVTPANDSPTAVADTFSGTNSALAGVTLAVGTTPATPNVAIGGNLLANDTDPDSPHADLTAAAPPTSLHGGVVAVNPDGTFTYTPAAGFTGADGFSYTVHDHGTPDRTSTGTVTINVAGPRVWFVQPGAAAGGDGTARAPFNSLAPLSTGGTADGLDGSGDVIFVYQGSAASSGFVLEANQQLVGQPQGLTVNDSLSRSLSLVPAGGSNPVIAGGLTLADGNTIQRVDETNGSVTGTNVNTLTYGANATISSGGLSLTGGSGTVSVGAHIFTDAGHTVAIANRTGGTTTLSGPVDDTGAGISLTGNTGAAVAFTGTITAGSFSATGGGVVTATGAGSRLASLSTALTVANTSIGAAGLKFQSISSNGAADGIVLVNTGGAAGLTVTGNGGTCTNADTSGCSGGEIQQATGADDASATPAGAGIVLNGTTAPSLSHMWIHDNSNYGIRGVGVHGFTLTNSVINGTNGTNGTDPFNDGSVSFDTLTGSATVSGSDIRGGYEDNFRVVNSSGSLDRITFSSDTFGDNDATHGNDALQLDSTAGAEVFKATIENSTFTAAEGDLVDFDHGGSGAGDLVITGSAFSNTHPGIATGGGGLTLSNEGTSGATTMTITQNTFRDAVGSGLLLLKTTGPSTQTGTFADNAIGVSGLANSGSAEGDALKLQTAGQGTMTWSVTGNQIHGYNNNGIDVEAGGGATAQSGALNTTITGNTIDQPGNTAGTLTVPKNGIQLNIGTVPNDTYQACAVIGGAGALANSLASSGADGVPAVGGGQDVRLRQRQSTTIRLPGYQLAPSDTAAVQGFVAANNPLGGPAVIASTSGSGGGFTGTGTSCP
jgi:hypothetical protein